MIRVFEVVAFAGLAVLPLAAQTSTPTDNGNGKSVASYHHRVYHRTNTKKKTPPVGSTAAPVHADR